MDNSKQEPNQNRPHNHPSNVETPGSSNGGSDRNGNTQNKLKNGVINKGQDYEYTMPALLALDLLFNKNVKNFSLSLNSSSFRKFDDLTVKVEYHDKTEEFAIQLKHREQGRDVLDAQTEFCGKNYHFKKKGKPFDIREYFNEYSQQYREIPSNCKIILFTNARFNNINNVEDFEVSIKTQPFETKLGVTDHVYQFRHKYAPNSDIRQNFHSNFFLFSGQKNLTETRKMIATIFREKFNSPEQIAICYMNFFQELRTRNYGEPTVTRDEIILHLLKLLHTDEMIIPCIKNKSNDNIVLVEKVIKEFELTVLKKVEKIFLSNTWTYKQDFATVDNLNWAKQLKLIPTNDQMAEESQKNDQSKQILFELLCSLRNGLLFLHFTEKSGPVISSIIPFLKSLNSLKLTLVVVGKDFKEDNFKDWKIFLNLNDLQKLNESLYREISQRFKISFQGRKPETIESLKQSGLDVDQLVTADEVFSFLEKDLLIGDQIKNLPKFHISRSLLRSDVQINRLKTLCEHQTTVVHCGGKSKEFKQVLQEENQFECEIRMSYPENLINHQKPLLILTDEDTCEQARFCHLYLKDTTLVWMNSHIDTTNPEVFNGQLNLLSGEPGIGKTTILTHLARNCPSSFWVTLVPLQQIHLNSKDTINERVKKLIISGFNKGNERFCDYFIEEKRVLFLFDGLNELNKQEFQNACSLIIKISRAGFKVWVTSTTNWKERMERIFKTPYSYVLEELTKKEQEEYITNKLSKTNIKKQFIDEIRKKWFNMDILKTPLVLFILTEVAQNQTEFQLDDTFNLSQMYTNFVEGKFQHNLKKISCEHIGRYHDILQVFRNFYKKGYENTALRMCLDDSLLHTDAINIEVDHDFIKSVKENNDFLELLIVTNDYTSFSHRTFAEYFSAMWIIKNFRKIPENTKNFIFQAKYQGIRKFFDYKLARSHPLHLAVLDEDITRVMKEAEKHLEDLDEGGRSALHLAVSLGRKHVVHNTNEVKTVQIKEDCSKHEDILKYLLNLNTNPEKDKLFGWDLVEYADASSCLFSLEELSKKTEITLSKLKIFSKNLFSLSYHCITNGYINLLQNIFHDIGIRKIDSCHKNPLLHLAVESNQTEIAMHLLHHGVNMIKTDSQKKTSLHVVAIYGNYTVAEELVKTKGEINARDNMGRTALHYAARMGHLEIVKLLLEKGGDINARDNEEKTPLHKAAFAGKQEVVELLIEKNSEIDALTSNGDTPLHRAAEAGHLNVVKFLVNQGSNKDLSDNFEMTALHYAATEGFEDIVKYLIDEKVDVFVTEEAGKTARQLAEERGYSKTAKLLTEAESTQKPNSSDRSHSDLHEAVLKNDLELLKKLLKDGALIEKINEKKETVLHVAAAEGLPEIVEFLLENNANSAARNMDDQVPLHFACQRGHGQVVKLLLNKEQNSATDKRGMTPIQWAAYAGHKEIVELLITADVDCNPTIKTGRTPLHSAAHNGHNDVIRLLLSKGADITKKDYKGQTCLHTAVSKNACETVKMLTEEFGKEILNEVDKDGNTALHIAAARKKIAAVDILLKGGADIDVRNNMGQTALDAAIAAGSEEVVTRIQAK